MEACVHGDVPIAPVYSIADCFADRFKELIDALLKSRHPKDWYRAYFNYGLLRKTLGMKRMGF